MGDAQGNPFPLPSRLPAGQGLLEPEPLEVSKCDRSRGAEWVWASASVTAAGNSIKARSSRHLRAPRDAASSPPAWAEAHRAPGPLEQCPITARAQFFVLRKKNVLSILT